MSFGLNTGLLNANRRRLRHLPHLPASARNTQILEYNVKVLREKLSQLEKVDEGKEIYLSKTNDTQLKVKFF